MDWDYSSFGIGNAQSMQKQNRLQELIDKMDLEAQNSRAANLARYNQALDIYSNIEKMFSPGNEMETAFSSNLDRMRKKDLASAAQAGVTSGLSQTTREQYAGKRWSEDVGVPALTQFQGQMAQQKAGAMGQKAQFIERREDVGPDYSAIASLTNSMYSK
jgi:hypothetical protein